jgi:hypothetical protein
VFRALDNLSDAVVSPKFHPWEITEAAARLHLGAHESLSSFSGFFVWMCVCFVKNLLKIC